MNKYQVLDDIGLTQQKAEIVECLKLRYKNSDPQCIISVDWLFYVISNQLQIIVYKIHIIHNEQYLLLSNLLNLLSNLEIYLDLAKKRLVIEETKVKEKLDELSTKKLRTKNTVKTSEQLSLSKDLQKVVHDDLEGLREMREATFSTLDTIITDRANTADIIVSLRFFGKRIQKTFPTNICCLNNGDHQQFIYNNIQYTSELALMMQDCSKLFEQNDLLKKIIEKNNILKQYERKTRKKTKNKMNNNHTTIMLYFENKNENENNIKILDLSEEFKKIKDKMR
eukprot:736952_1